MQIDPNKRSRFLKLLEFAIGFCYLSLSVEHRVYIFIAAAHFVSVLLHTGD